MTIALILLIAAAICFALVTFNIRTSINLMGLGLLLWVLSLIVPGVVR